MKIRAQLSAYGKALIVDRYSVVACTVCVGRNRIRELLMVRAFDLRSGFEPGNRDSQSTEASFASRKFCILSVFPPKVREGSIFLPKLREISVKFSVITYRTTVRSYA